MALRPARGLAWQTIDGEGVVLDLERGRSIGLNPAGALVFSLLETHAEEAIAVEVSRQFEVSLERSRADVSRFLGLLRERGLAVEE
jgi:predicted DNA-binding transcriptional regulator